MDVKKGILITTSYTPPRLSTIEWVEERRAVVIITKQDGEDMTDKGLSERQRWRPKHAIIPWDGDPEFLKTWKSRIDQAIEMHRVYTDFVAAISDSLEAAHIDVPDAEEWEAANGKKPDSAAPKPPAPEKKTGGIPRAKH